MICVREHFGFVHKGLDVGGIRSRCVHEDGERLRNPREPRIYRRSELTSRASAVRRPR